MSGAIDIRNCPNWTQASACRCKPVCSVCGFGPHVAVHGPVMGEPVGSKPYDHEYKPAAPKGGQQG